MKKTLQNIIIVCLIALSMFLVVAGLYNWLSCHFSPKPDLIIFNPIDSIDNEQEIIMSPEEAQELQKILKKSYWRMLKSSSQSYQGLATALTNSAENQLVGKQTEKVKEDLKQLVHIFLQHLILTPDQAIKAHAIIQTINEYIQKSKSIPEDSLLLPEIEEELNQLHLKLIMQVGPLLNILQSDITNPSLQKALNSSIEFIEQLVTQTLREIEELHPEVKNAPPEDLNEPFVPELMLEEEGSESE